MTGGVTIVQTRPAAHQTVHANALLRGLTALGIESAIQSSAAHIKTKRVACWGWRLGRRLREAGHDVLVMERGYVGDRFSYTSLGWNGLNGYAAFQTPVDDHGQRFADHGGVLKPWKTGGQNVLILGQVPNDASLKGLDMLPFYAKWAEEAQSAYGFPVAFRQHPDLNKRGLVQNVIGTERSTGSLAEALDLAAICLTFNSNSAVDAVLAGVPTITLDHGSMATDVTAHDIGAVYTPDRSGWASALAWKQWSLAEIESGEAVRNVLQVVQ